MSTRSTSDWNADHNAWSGVEYIPSALRGGHDIHTKDLQLDDDLHPLPGSVLVNAGQEVGVSEDFEGKHRSDGHPDIGAFEYTRVYLGLRILLPIVSANAYQLPPRP